MSSKSKKGVSSKISDDGMEDEIMDEKGVIKRKSRNLSEKKRRDQFNILINELCSMVCSGKRKVDKSTILKSAISFIRNHNQVTMQSHCQETAQEDWKPSFLSNEEFTHLMLEALDEFIIVFSASGKILYVSENVTSLLGHTPNALIGSVVTRLVLEEESQMLESLLASWRRDGGNEKDPLRYGQWPSPENHVTFACHIRRGNICNTEGGYEQVNFSGYLRFQGNSDAASVSHLSSSWADENSKESTNCGDALAQYSGLVFVGSARLHTPQLSVEMSIVDVSKSEFTSRHSLEWKFLFLDHRGPPIIGYLPFEVLGTSGYDYYHIDDLEKVAQCHEALMQKGEVTSCCYRFLTKGQQWIWLQTKYYITYHQWYSKPEFIVCSHRVISFNEIAGNASKTEGVVTDVASESRNTDSDFGSSYKIKSEVKPSVVQSKEKPSLKGTVNVHDHSSNLEGGRRISQASSNRERSRMNRQNVHRRYYQQSNSSTSDAQQSGRSSSCGGGDSVLLSPPPPLTNNDSGPRQNSRHPSGSSRVGAALSDTNSMSSTGSFQSAASQHSRQSDQSMHSYHSQQSHHSMQSVHSQLQQQQQQQQQQPQQQPQPQQASNRSAGQTCSGHSCVNPSHQHNASTKNLPGAPSYFPSQQQQYSPASSSSSRNTPHSSRTEDSEKDTSRTTGGSAQSNVNAGHRFLQPRVNNTTNVKRAYHPSSDSPATAVSASNHAPVEPGNAFSFHQPVGSVAGVESSNMPAGGVALPVQRIIEGLPVVTLPGIVAHEPLVLTPAQRSLHEQLRLKHLEIQKSIIAQQEELRRVSEKLILAQYGAWGPTVLKMTVPYSSDPTDGSSSQSTHTVLSAGGLVTCLATETPISLGQISSAPQLAGSSAVGTMTLSPGASILVHSPELHALSPTDRSNDPTSISTDPSQVVLRTALQQETLVQLSQQDIQMLLQHSNFLP